MKIRRSLIITSIFCLVLCSCSPLEGNADSQENTTGDKSPLVLTVYDAGKGDAFLISGQGFNMMMDCGYKDCADEILIDLARKGIKRLDLIVISHFDKDHVGGASKILKNIPVSRVITTRQTNEDKRTLKFFEALSIAGLKNEVPDADIVIDKGDCHVLISPPEKNDYPDSEDNNSSLLVKVYSSCGALLFTGDAEKYRVDEMLARDDLKCDLLKIPHHGTESWRLEELLRKADPKVAVITSSREEPADEEVLSALKSAGVQYYNTVDTGSFELSFDEKGIHLK